MFGPFVELARLIYTITKQRFQRNLLGPYKGWVENNISLRDAIIKENPVISGFLQIGGGGGSQRPPDQDFLHVI